MDLNISNRKVGGVTVVDLSGRLVLGEATSAFRNTVKGLVEGGEKKILLNLSKLNYMDSSGIGALVGGYTTVSGAQGQVKLTGLNGKVHDLLRITKLLTVFEVIDDEAKAVRSFA
jgi:anti-sigma B factor antagonist